MQIYRYIALETQISYSCAILTFAKYSYSNLHISNDLLNTISSYMDIGVLITENLKVIIKLLRILYECVKCTKYKF